MKKLGVFFLLCASSAMAAPNDGFVINNHPINPACVSMFNSSEADMPYIRAINMNVCQDSNAASHPILKNERGQYYYFENDKNEEAGSYYYKVMGKTSNGIYAVQTISSGGGTLASIGLLLLRLDQRHETIFDMGSSNIKNITELKLLGYVRGGDRCSGGIMNAIVKGNQVIYEQSHGENPVDCNLKKYTIDLSKVVD